MCDEIGIGVKTSCNLILVRTKNGGHNCECIYGVFLKVTHQGTFDEFSGGISILPKWQWIEDSLHPCVPYNMLNFPY